MKNSRHLRMGVVVIAILATAFALSASAGAQPAGGPKAAHITYMSMWDGQADIYAMDTAGLAQINLTHDKTVGSRADSEPVWSPDGQFVAFQRNFVASRSDTPGGSSLYVVRSNGAGLHALTFSPNSAVRDRASDVVAEREHHRVLEQPDRPFRAVHGQGLRQRARAAHVHQPERRQPRAGDGTRRDVDRLRAQRPGCDGVSSGVDLVPLADDGTDVPAHDAGPRPHGRAAGLVLDSSRIAFQSDRAGNEDIYVVDRKGNVVRVTSAKTNEYHPSWAPTGNAIALISDRTGATEIYSLTLPLPGR